RDVAQRWQSLGQRLLHLPGVDVLDDLVPQHAPAFFPTRIFLIEPLALFARNARVGLPEQGRTPEPRANMHRMVAMFERGLECVPVPRLFEAIVTEDALVMLDDPLEHKLFKRHFPFGDGCVVIHRSTGQRLEQSEGPPESDVEDLLRALWVVLDDDVECWEA